MEFHWWYILVALVLIFIIFGKGKGGMVVQGFYADLQILDERFQGCEREARYSIFKEGKPHHIEIELEGLTIPVGDKLDFMINGKKLATVLVEQDKEAEFEHWSDGNVSFPVIKEGDELIIKYQNADALKGTFRLKA